MKYSPVLVAIVSLLTIDQLVAESLQERLDARSAEFAGKAAPELMASQAAALNALREAEVAENALGVGDSAPDFMLKDHEGKEVGLHALLQNGPVILTWYRGGWCPYCNIALQAWIEVNPDIIKRGATLLALTPELPDATAATVKKHGLPFVVLTDLNHVAAEKFGLVFKLDQDTAKRYEEKFQLSLKNGADAGTRLPLPATYVIASDRKIAYAFLNPDYKKRAEPAKAIEVLDGLAK